MHRPQSTYQVNGAQIRKLRMAAGLTIACLATRAAISVSYLTLLELGIRRHMRPPTYTALRTALGLKPDDEQLLAPTEDSDPEEVT